MNTFGLNGWRDPEKVGSPSLEELLENGCTRCEKCLSVLAFDGKCPCEPSGEAPQAPEESDR